MILSQIVISVENLLRLVMIVFLDIILRINVFVRSVEVGLENMFLIEYIDYIQQNVKVCI